jgi:hypothetical protein
MAFINRKKISNKEQKKKNSSFAYTKPGKKFIPMNQFYLFPFSKNIRFFKDEIFFIFDFNFSTTIFW